MEDDCHAVHHWQTRKGVLKLIPHLSALKHLLRHDGPVVVVPVGLHRLEINLVAMDARAVDDPVDQASAEPTRQRRWLAELVAPAPGANDRLLGAVLGLVWITDQPRRKADEPRQLVDEGLGERVAQTSFVAELGRHVDRVVPAQREVALVPIRKIA